LLGYFRINDPYRLVIIFILLLILRLPYLISSEWLSIPELKWMLIGERMNDGAMLYVDIWDDIAPLSALVYKGINFAARKGANRISGTGSDGLLFPDILHQSHCAQAQNVQ
jgi:hypothetical protein